MKIFLPIIFIITCFPEIVKNANILGVFPQQFYSHSVLTNALIEELVKRGHNVTVISLFPPKHNLENLTTIQLVGKPVIFQGKESFTLGATTFVSREMIFYSFLMEQTEFVLSNRAVQEFLKTSSTFDLVIYQDLVTHAIMGFCYYFQAPCIEFTTMGLNKLFSAKIGNPLIPSYVPDYQLPLGSKMIFLERTYNLIVHIFTNVFRDLWTIPQHNRLLQKYFPRSPHIYEFFYNVSLVLMNSHISTSQPLPIMPNLIGIGKFHIKSPNRLPEDLQEYLDNAKNGVVYFSMGTISRSIDMPIVTREMLLKTFSKLKQKVLWKYEDESLSDVPPNVKISKWLSQSDVLAHPNVKLFITHGGLLSLSESIYHATPIIGIPIAVDQKTNIMQLVAKGVGLGIPYSELTEKRLLEAIQEVLANSTYKSSVTRLSVILHDRPMEPIQEAIFWIEHVIRQKGGLYFRSKALDLSWYQYILLDVVATLIILAVSIITLLYTIIRITLRFLKIQ